MDFGLAAEIEKKESASFKGMNIPIEILANIKYNIATPIQRKVIPKLLSGQDIIAISRTGSGKTYAYVIPILMNLLKNRQKKTVYTTAKAIIIVPTYELANQLSDTFKELSSNGVHPAMFTGIGTVSHSLNYLVVGQFEVAICTPGRLEHILTDVSASDNKPIYMKVDENNHKKEICITDTQILQKISQPDIVVIDEMDRILEDKSLSLSLQRILEYFKNDPQYALFSATHHKDSTQIRNILNRKDMELIEVLGGVSDHLESSRLVINNLHIQEEIKMPILMSLLKVHSGRVLVFVSTCKRCTMVSEAVSKTGRKLGILNSTQSEEARDLVVKGFKTGDISVLVTTDVGCRGLDIRGIDVVVEYDYPACRSTSVHRVGRLNRGRSERGIVYALIRTADIPTYLAFLNHIHTEKPRDMTRCSRLCFHMDKCATSTGHSNCAYLGLGTVPAQYYDGAQEVARSIVTEDAGYDRSYARYAKTNPAEKVDAQWVVRAVSVRDIPVHPCFHMQEKPVLAAIRAYKARGRSGPGIGRERVKKITQKSETVDMDKFKDPAFIPYENVKSSTFAPCPEMRDDKSGEIKRRAQKMRRPPGEMFMEWKKESRDRLSKGYLLTRPPSQEREDGGFERNMDRSDRNSDRNMERTSGSYDRSDRNNERGDRNMDRSDRSERFDRNSGSYDRNNERGDRSDRNSQRSDRYNERPDRNNRNNDRSDGYSQRNNRNNQSLDRNNERTTRSHDRPNTPKTRKSDGDLVSVRRILEARKKKERDSRRMSYASDRKSQRGRI
ncbi:ATP-dependent RNA helicase DDX54/DBP10 [Nematocida ausubeli]|nr:ATP-dependent RNA helicase DDX54/DBP10 [Nematocida ausubeli]KAI5138178.1 ATP-dependent RNA helicase DDX54/DBP10 [Nematocida ausubeli]